MPQVYQMNTFAYAILKHPGAKKVFFGFFWFSTFFLVFMFFTRSLERRCMSAHTGCRCPVRGRGPGRHTTAPRGSVMICMETCHILAQRPVPFVDHRTRSIWSARRGSSRPGQHQSCLAAGYDGMKESAWNERRSIEGEHGGYIEPDCAHWSAFFSPPNIRSRR